MNDLVSRQALLDKFEPWLKVKDYNTGELNMLKAILYEIRFAPELSANLAEVGTDCISREQAIDALYHVDEYNSRSVEAIRNLPPAEPQIIRCKDCKNWDTTWTNDFSPNYHYCPMVDGVRKEDWFCADAEMITE